MGSLKHRFGYALVTGGLCLVLAGLMIVVYDASQWWTLSAWPDTSLRALFGPLAREESELGALKAGLWVQPLWLLMAAGGALVALLGSVFMDD